MTDLKLSRRKFLHLAAGAAALPVASRFAWAQTYPTRPVRIVVPFPPAGGADIAARLLAQWLSERLGQQFVVENRPGAGGNIGTEAVVRASPDGYTLLLTLSPNAVNATLYEKLNFDFIREIAPVGSISRESNLIVVHPSLPPKSVPEFIAYAKANPGKLNFVSGGSGTTPHMAGELFKMMTGVLALNGACSACRSPARLGLCNKIHRQMNVHLGAQIWNFEFICPQYEPLLRFPRRIDIEVHGR